jgi:hypothetical protein
MRRSGTGSTVVDVQRRLREHPVVLCAIPGMSRLACKVGFLTTRQALCAFEP